MKIKNLVLSMLAVVCIAGLTACNTVGGATQGAAADIRGTTGAVANAF